jgi:hypothetical protein
MSDHKRTLVKLETWAYHSPRLAARGVHTNLGAVAEALVYYDEVMLNIQHERELQALVDRFASEGLSSTLTALFADGTLQPYHFAFHSAPIIHPDGSATFVNLQSQEQVEPGWFDTGILNRLSLQHALPKGRHRKSFFTAARSHLVEVKASSFGAAIDNARLDFGNEPRAILLVQALLDDVHELVGLSEAPEVTVKITRSGDQVRTTWNVDLEAVGRALGLRVDAYSPAAAAILGNRLIWAAATQNCDLFIDTSLSRIIGDKLYEVAAVSKTRPQEIIREIQQEVQFPDVQALVNSGQLSFGEALKLRAKAVPFRRWLQTQSERDDRAIWAYHHEVAKEAGFTRVARRTLKYLTTVGGPAIGGVVTAAASHWMDVGLAGAAGALAGGGAKFLFDTLSRLGEGWTPVVFGEWANARIKKYVDEHRPDAQGSRRA